MSSDNISISVNNLTKTYRIFGNPGDRIKQSMSFGLKKYHREFTAIKDVSFEVKKGETIGIIGHNGSGKSTLLQLICGILKPTSGTVEVNGRVSALLELGAGFNPEFTGRENVYFQGALMGLTKEEMENRFDDIAAFADIGEFIDQPVRVYSSGMFVRLAFSVAAHVEPEVLVIDEALSVGDMVFQERSIRKMHDLLNGGCSLVFVSHEFSAIKSLCKHALLLENGKISRYGESGTVCDDFIRSQLAAPTNAVNESIQGQHCGGSGKARVIAVKVELPSTPVCQYGCDLTLRIDVMVEADIPNLVVSFYVKDSHRLEVLGTSTVYEGLTIGSLSAGEMRSIEFSFRNPLRAGIYDVTVILSDNATSTNDYYDWVDHACDFESYDQPGQMRWAITCPRVEANLLPSQSVDGDISQDIRGS